MTAQQVLNYNKYTTINTKTVKKEQFLYVWGTFVLLTVSGGIFQHWAFPDKKNENDNEKEASYGEY